MFQSLEKQLLERQWEATGCSQLLLLLLLQGLRGLWQWLLLYHGRWRHGQDALRPLYGQCLRPHDTVPGAGRWTWRYRATFALEAKEAYVKPLKGKEEGRKRQLT